MNQWEYCLLILIPGKQGAVLLIDKNSQNIRLDTGSCSNAVDFLNQFGQEGWEVCEHSNDTGQSWTLKRRIA
jgi:hypothetical protein